MHDNCFMMMPQPSKSKSNQIARCLEVTTPILHTTSYITPYVKRFVLGLTSELQSYSRPRLKLLMQYLKENEGILYLNTGTTVYLSSHFSDPPPPLTSLTSYYISISSPSSVLHL